MFVIRLSVVTGVSNMTDPTWWDATIPKRLYSTIEVLESYFEEKCDRWCAGNETGKETGYEHWQFRGVFRSPKSLKQLKDWMPGVHWTPSHERDFNYCEKEGDYYRSWEKALRKFSVDEWKPWEVSVNSMIERENSREIVVIVDEEGGHGKTAYAKKLVAKHMMEYIPQMQNPKDYMRVAYAKRNARGFFIDICMCQNYHNKFEGSWQGTLWNACESMKNGLVYDERNSWKEAWIEPPKIVVAMNEWPDESCLAKDRWCIVTLEGPRGHEYVQWHPVK